MIDANKLRNEAKLKKKFKIECFEKIFQMCLNKIEIVSKTNIDKTWFEIPNFILGYPKYEPNEISTYLIKSLKKLDFNSWMVTNTIIVIDWSSED